MAAAAVTPTKGSQVDNGQRRIYLGIHWKFDKTESILLGRKVGDYVFDNVFRPV